MLRAVMTVLRKPGFWAFASLVVVWLGLYGVATYIGPVAPPARVTLAGLGVGMEVHRHVAGLVALALGLVGMGFGYRLARRHASETAALDALVLVGLGTGIVIQASLSRGGWALGFAAWLFDRWDRTRGQATPTRYAALGALVGGAAAARPELLVLGLLPLVDLGIALGRRRDLRLLAGGVLGALLAILPSLLLHGWVGLPGASPLWAEALWSTRTGWFVWAPLTAVAVLGLLAAPWRTARTTAIALFGMLAALVFVDGAVATAGPAMADRPLVAATGLLLAGLAFLVDRLRALHHRWPGIAPHAALWLILGPLVVLNLELTRQVSYGSRSAVRTSAPQSTANLYAGSFARMIQQSFDRIGSPPAFPANLVWAARHGLAPSRWDVIAGSPVTEITAAELGFLTGEWGPLVDETRATGRNATVLLPLRSAAVRLELDVSAGSSATWQVEIAGWHAPPGDIGAVSPVVVAPPPGVLRPGTNEVVIGPGVRFRRLRIVHLE